MSALNGFRRRLKPNKVYFAQKVAEKKVEFARNVVLERAKKDAEFAADVLKAVGNNLPTEVKEACEKSVYDAKTKALVEKWEKTGLLEGTCSLNNVILIESQETPLLDNDDTICNEQLKKSIDLYTGSGLANASPSQESVLTDAKTCEKGETCIVCGDKEPCSHDFYKLHSDLENVGKIMGSQELSMFPTT